MLLDKKERKTTKTKQKIKPKILVRAESWTQSDALPLDNWVKWKYLLLSSYLTVSTQWVET